MRGCGTLRGAAPEHEAAMFLPHDLEVEHRAQIERIRRTVEVKSSLCERSVRLFGLLIFSSFHTVAGLSEDLTGIDFLILALFHLVTAEFPTSQRAEPGR